MQNRHRLFPRPRLRFRVIREKPISTPPCVSAAIFERVVSAHLTAHLQRDRLFDDDFRANYFNGFRDVVHALECR